MMEELNCWDEKLIHEILMRDEAAKICRIPLSGRSDEDKIVWGHTKNGNFSVRSAYYFGSVRERSCKRNLLIHKLKTGFGKGYGN